MNHVIEHVVLLIHGIRTQADWQEMVVDVLEGSTTKVIPIRYGYFDVFRFWFPFKTRSKPINRVEKEIENVKELYPKARLSIIAHSYGTYIIGRILHSNFNLNIDKLIFCGSVLKASYSWEEAYRRGNIKKEGIINECGKKDIWPILAKITSWGYGDSGTHGFGCAFVTDRFHNVTHGEYLKRGFVEIYWRPFILNDICESSPFQIPRPPTPWWLSLLGILPLKTLIISGLIFCTSVPYHTFIGPKPPENHSPKHSLNLAIEILNSTSYDNPRSFIINENNSLRLIPGEILLFRLYATEHPDRYTYNCVQCSNMEPQANGHFIYETQRYPGFVVIELNAIDNKGTIIESNELAISVEQARR